MTESGSFWIKILLRDKRSIKLGKNTNRKLLNIHKNKIKKAYEQNKKRKEMPNTTVKY